MKRLTAFLVASSLLFVSAEAFAHGDEKHGRDHHDHSGLCETFTTKTENQLPDFSDQRWEIVRILEKGFRYIFYKDKTRPDIPVAAMSVSSVSPGTNVILTRVTWQTEDRVMTARVEIDEMVCVRPLQDRTGAKRNLSDLMRAIEKIGGHQHR